MKVDKIIPILLASMLLFTACHSGQEENVVSDSAPLPNDIAITDRIEEPSDSQNNEKSHLETLGNVLPFTSDEVASFEIKYRNISEVKSAVFEGEAAKLLTNEILALEIKEFNEKYDPITGGDRLYIITLKNGDLFEIKDDASITINNEERYLLSSWRYELSIPDDTVWKIEKR